ncbi:MAG: TonB family protein [Planctomycetota bacterium]
MFQRLMIAPGAVLLTVAFFLVLPLFQSISQPPSDDLVVRTVETADVPPPPSPPEEEPEKETEPEEKPPELNEETPPLDLSQLELALDPAFSGDWLAGDFAVKLTTAAADSRSTEALFSAGDLDQAPRVLYQPGPVLSGKVRQRAPGTVHIVFSVDERGKVENAVVQSSTDPVFDKPALAAVRQWKFESGKRNGRPVRFHMRVPITFPKGL